MTRNINYIELFAKYLAHVGLVEGVDFVNKIYKGKGGLGRIPFSDEEIEILKAAQDLSEKYYNYDRNN